MDFTAYDLRVGTVASAVATGDALTLTIELGAGGTRTATTYIRENYSAESLVGRQVVVVTNLPGADEAVLLAALSSADGAALLQPDRPVPDGTQVV